ncbi:GNAT family N-acetyltransferase [Promineifilum sp.]|uniref:GNAT family N-acetyltransferase n=1 Tax=Promineifilum sp. TaxID=2664178 RepID=UPI0035B0B8E6
MVVRSETENDYRAVRQVNEVAFGRPAEANLVDALRRAGAVIDSLVAEQDGAVVGHILFSPATLTGEEGVVDTAALGPMAVLPAYQRLGIGGELVRAGLDRCREAGYGLCMVLGHAEYYPRFGFRPSRPLGIRWEHDVAEPYFMVAELRAGALEGATGVVRYRPEFDGV